VQGRRGRNRCRAPSGYGGVPRNLLRRYLVNRGLAARLKPGLVSPPGPPRTSLPPFPRQPCSTTVAAVASISASVGRGGRNLAADVKTVQRLLNLHLASIPPTKKLDDDGACGNKTIAAIEAFQRNVVRMREPDKRVDPGGRTLDALNGGPVVAPSTAAAVAVRPSFLNAWNSYPTVSSPCDQGWENQCAVRLSVTFNAEGTIKVNSHTYSEPRCKHGHARGAESLARWLWGRLGRPRIYKDPAVAKRALANSQGIIFFKDCFTRTGETARVGDHIDLWYRGRTKTYDDPGNKSSEVWFWDLP
jgi:hypothetical protein